MIGDTLKKIIADDPEDQRKMQQLERERNVELSIKTFETAGFHVGDKVRVNYQGVLSGDWEILSFVSRSCFGREVAMARVTRMLASADGAEKMSVGAVFVNVIELSGWNPTKPYLDEQARENQGLDLPPSKE